MEYALLGWPEDGPTLRLDHREFAYAGKFVMGTTGKAVAREPRGSGEDGRGGGEDGRGDDENGTGGGEDGTGGDGNGSGNDEDEGRDAEGGSGSDADGAVVAAVAFSADRTDPATAWLRYVTVRADRRGDGVGPRLCAFAVARLAERGYERVRIAVNNPFAFEALHRVGFAWTGERTGLAELVLERPAGAPASGPEREERYRAGLDEYRGREGLSGEERDFLTKREGAGPPDVLDSAVDGDEPT